MSIKDSSTWQRRRRFKGDKGRDMSFVTCPDCKRQVPQYYFAGHRLDARIHPGAAKRYARYMDETNEKLKRLERSFDSE